MSDEAELDGGTTMKTRRRRSSRVAAEQKSSELAAASPTVSDERVWITLEDNPDIPPRGQFFGINGAGFILRPGQRAFVPRGIVDILDNAVVMVPRVNPDTLRIDGWVEKLRYPYRIHTSA